MRPYKKVCASESVLLWSEMVLHIIYYLRTVIELHPLL